MVSTLEGKIAYRSLLQLQAGVTMQKAEYKQARAWSDDETVPMEKKMFRTPNTYGYFTLSYNPFVPMTIALSGTYTGSMMVEHKAGFIDKDIAVNTPDFFELNLKAGYDFNLYKGIIMQVNAGVHNIFNAYQKVTFDRGAKNVTPVYLWTGYAAFLLCRSEIEFLICIYYCRERSAVRPLPAICVIE